MVLRSVRFNVLLHVALSKGRVPTVCPCQLSQFPVLKPRFIVNPQHTIGHMNTALNRNVLECVPSCGWPLPP
jgi:hypothetical protein